MEKMLAVILAGGKGKRMNLLCCERPKPTLPFAGGRRVIDFTLSNCINSRITNFAVLVDHQRHLMIDYLRQWIRANTHGIDVRVLEPRGGSYRGTADAVYQNLDYLQRYNPEAVLVLAGDHVYRMDYRKMLAFHEQVEADVTVGVVSVPIEAAHRFGIATVDFHNRIIDFEEKPPIPSSNLASMGIYIFNPRVLSGCLIEDSVQKDSLHDFGHAIIPKMVRQNKVFAYHFDGYWQDIGSIEAYYEANMELIRELPALSLNGTWPILTKDNSLVSSVVHDDRIRRSLVSPGCVIKGEVENSVLSTGVTIEKQTVVRNSIIMADTVIGSNSVVDRCILDEGIDVGQFCYLGFGADLLSRNMEITVLGKGLKIPRYSKINSRGNVSANMGNAGFIVNAINPASLLVRQ